MNEQPILTDRESDEARTEALAGLHALFEADNRRSLESTLEPFAALAAGICQLPGGFVSLVIADRCRCAATHGIVPLESPQVESFCQLVIEKDSLIVLNDIESQFYAAVPIRMGQRFTLGAIGVFDSHSHDLNDSEAKSLERLAQAVEFVLDTKLREFRELRGFARSQPQTTFAISNTETTQQRELETRLRALFEHAFQFIGILSVDGVLLDANATALNSVGVTRDEVLNRPFWETPWWNHSPDLQGRLRQAINKAAGGEMDRFMSSHSNIHGELIHVDVSIKPVFDKNGQVSFLLPEGRDVTALQIAELELASAKAKLAIAVQIAAIGVWDWDVVQDKVFVSTEYLSQIGVDDREPWTYGRFLDRLHPEDRRRIDDAVRQHFNGEMPRYEVTFRLRHANGGYRWIEARGRILVDPNGKPIRMVGVHLDVTARKNDQERLESMVEALARSNQDLEQFAYVASHDLQEPLRAVAVYCQFLEQDYAAKLDSEGRRYIQVAVKAAMRMKKLIDDLLQFSRVGRDSAAFESMDLNEVCREAMERLQTSIDESTAEVHICRLPTITGNRGRMVQLFQNLIGNAIKYRSEYPPRIEVLCNDVGPVWRLEFRDNGIGVPAEFAEEIFRVFRRLHDRKKIEGTGIGLAICRRIAEMHQGRIWCQATGSSGTSFFVDISQNICPSN